MARNVNTAVDSADFFVENRDVAIQTIVATATSTQTGADQKNTLQRGVILNPVFSTIAATCTVRFTVQGKDDISGLFYTVTSLSLDGITTGNVNTIMAGAPLVIHPNAPATPVTGTGVAAVLPAKFRVITSITATASQGGALVSLSVNASKVV
jgi:hypothetical protein